MSNVKIFNHEQFGAVRTIYKEKQDEVWFVGKDVAESLGYKRPTKAIQDHIDMEDKDEVLIQDSIGRNQSTPIINESGMYSLILRSNLPQAKQFKRWVTSEVLPSIRKSGGYIANQENSTPEQILANAVLVAQNVIKEKELQLEREKLLRQEAEETIKLQSPKVQAWEQLMDINKNLDMGATARAFNVSGLGRNNFMKLLRDKEILQKNNNPYQYYMDRGYFEVIVIPNEFAQTKTVVTPKGLKWLAGKLVEWGYIG